MSPSPSTAVPSLTTATVFCLIVRFQTFSGSSAIADETRATPGVYAIERSSLVLIGAFSAISILPPRCIRNVRSETLIDLDARHLVHGVGDRVHVRGVVREHGDVADLRPALDPDEVDRAERAAGLADRLGEAREGARGGRRGGRGASR